MNVTDVYTIDFETYYSSEYSLGKITTQEYILDKQFQIIGVGISKNREEATWHSFDNLDDYAKLLAPLHGSVVMAHNAAFDCGILGLLFDIKPSVILDTLSMAKPIFGLTVGGSLKALAEKYKIGVKGTEVVDAKGKRLEDFTPEELAKYGEYCKNDVELTNKLYPLLKKHTNRSELRVIDKTVRMFTEPRLILDTELLIDAYELERAYKRELLIKCGTSRAVLMSNPQFAEELKRRGVEPPMKKNPKGKDTFAFAKADKEFISLLSHEDESIRNLVEARLGLKSTINETRMKRLIDLSALGPLCVPLGYCGALTTWRWSGQDGLNLQNLPSRGDNTIRKAIRAPEGHVLVVADSSNIELRTVHTMAGQQDTVKKLRAGVDLYKDFAADLFGVPFDEVTKEQRFVGKVAHLSLGYQSGWATFKDMVRQFGGHISEPESKKTVNAYRGKYRYIKGLWDDSSRLIRGMRDDQKFVLPYMESVYSRSNMLVTPPSHYIQYPQLDVGPGNYGPEYTYKSRRGKGTETVKLYGGKVTENLCQHISRNILAEQFVTISNRFPVALMVHDEFILVVPEDEAEEALRWTLEIMSESPTWWPEIPLSAEGDIAERYGDAK